MKVLLLNGSPHKNGCVFTALSEVESALTQNGITSEIYWIGNHAVQGCIACYKCSSGDGCVFKDRLYIELVEKIREADGLIILDRVCFSASTYFKHKPAACVVNCRRGGASAAFERLNKYFTILEMPVVSSQYWNSTHGTTPDELRRDLEGLQTMRTLGNNMAYMLKSLSSASLPLPPEEEWIATNFIR